MTSEAALYFSRELLAWYRGNKRELPWRMNADPYRIWVSEVMLQQTRVDTVIPYYERFMNKFPTAAALAEAPEEEVLKCWEGLGYYSRARNLQAGASEVVSRHGGIVPDDKEAVASLRGVGPYTAGAIMSIAFNRPEPAVDGNVMRVLSRYFCLEDDIAKPAARIKIEKLAASLIPEGAAGDFNQALMELGALVCTPKSPGCLTCPVMRHCEGRMAGREHELPVKSKAKPPRPETRLAALVVGSGEHAGKVLVRQRPGSGLLARMWELPHVAAPQAGGGAAAKPRGRGRAAAAAGTVDAAASAGGMNHTAQAELLCRSLYEQDGLLVRPVGWWGEAEHIFSHIVWDVQVYRAEFGYWLANAAAMEQEAGSDADDGGYVHSSGFAGHMLAAERRSLYSALTDHSQTGREPEQGNTSTSGALPPRSSAGAAAGTDEHGVWEEAAPAERSGTDRKRETEKGDTLMSGALPSHYRWIGPEHMRELAFPNVFLRLLRDYWITAE